MKFEFCYDNWMLDIQAETDRDEKILDSLLGKECQVLANAKFIDTNRRALIITFSERRAMEIP